MTLLVLASRRNWRAVVSSCTMLRKLLWGCYHRMRSYEHMAAGQQHKCNDWCSLVGC